MASIEELEARIAALEERERVNDQVRTGIDSDLSDTVSKIRAMHHLVQALAITQTEHTDQLSRILSEHGSLLRDHTVRLARIEQGVTTITDILQTLIDRETGE